MAAFKRASLGIAGIIVVLGAAGWFAGTREAERRLSELTAEHSLAKTRHGTIEYLDWGEGPAVLVIHGAGGGFDQGRLLAQAVGGEGFRFVAVSRFGYLGSDMPADPSTHAQAQALQDLVDHLGIERVNILAMSGGVPPALQFAQSHPDRTDSMVLLSSAPFTPFSPQVEDRPIPTWAYAKLLGNDAVYWALTKAARGQLRHAFDARADLVAGLPQAEGRFVDDLIDGFIPASARLAGIGNEAAAVDPKAVYRLETIAAPALVVHSRDDSLNPFAVGEALARRLPNAQMLAFDRGGHLLLGHHAQLREQIGLFLGRDR